MEEFQEYTYEFNVKILGVPELGPTESAEDRSNLCLKIFATRGAHATLSDIDIAHHVAVRDASRTGQNRTCASSLDGLREIEWWRWGRKFVRSALKLLDHLRRMTCPTFRVVDHLTPRKQKLYFVAKAFSSDTYIHFAGPRMAQYTSEKRPSPVLLKSEVLSPTRTRFFNFS